MDPSALIFVALAVAWAAYLVPKALKHHDDAVRSRSVERFSHTMRVLARREPLDRKSARLVVTPGRPASTAVVVTKPSASDAAQAPQAPQAPDTPAAPAAEVAPPAPVELTPAERRARRAAAKRATKRRRNVLAVLLLANAVVVTLAAVGVHSWLYVAIPGALLVAWLVLCRVMVKKEHAALAPRAAAPAPEPAVAEPAVAEPAVATEEAPVAQDEQVVGEVTEEIAIVTDGGETDVRIESDVRLDPTLWDPVPVTLPTYVSKPAAARRTVRQIAIDDTGVWTSGRTEADAKLAREADQADRDKKAKRADGDDRAVGS